MVLETGQILSIAVRRGSVSLDGEESVLYQPTHENHPCCVWASASPANGQWTLRLLVELGAEYTHRYDREHATCERLLPFLMQDHSLPPPTDFPNCTTYPQCGNPHHAYQQYLRDKWRAQDRPPAWTRRDPPLWNVRKYTPIGLNPDAG